MDIGWKYCDEQGDQAPTAYLADGWKQNAQGAGDFKKTAKKDQWQGHGQPGRHNLQKDRRICKVQDAYRCEESC